MIENNLPAILAKKDMSIRELSFATGVTYSMVYDAVNQKRRSIRLDVLAKICEVLNVQPGNIYKYTPNIGGTNDDE